MTTRIDSITLPVILNTVLPRGTKIAVKEAKLRPNWFNLKKEEEITMYRTEDLINLNRAAILNYKPGYYSLDEFKAIANANSQRIFWIDVTPNGKVELKVSKGYAIMMTHPIRELLGLALDESTPKPKIKATYGPGSHYGRHQFNQLDHATLHLEHIDHDIHVRNDTQLDRFHYFHLDTSYKLGDSMYFHIENPIFHTLSSTTDTLRLTLKLPDGTDISSSLKYLLLYIIKQ